MFSEKRIKVEIDLNVSSGKLWGDSEVSTYLTFSGGNLNGISGQSFLGESNTLIFEDFRVDLNIRKVFSPVGPTANIKIYGVSKEHMNMITTIALRNTITIPNRRVRVSVNDGTGYITLFEGCIVEAVPVYQTAPDCYIQIESSVAAYENEMKLPPISFPTQDAAISSLCKSTCAAYGLNCYTSPMLDLEPKVKPIILNQDGLQARMAALCEAYDLSAIRVTDGYRVFKNGEGAAKPWHFTPETMNGYPTYQKKTIRVDTDAFKNIEVCDWFRVSGSEIPFANGLWNIVMIQYRLQSRTPNGKWTASLYGTPKRED